MWKLKKPSLEVATGEDINNLVLHCRSLSDADKPILKELYEQYDAQNGSVTNGQHGNVPANKAEAIKGQYEKTYKGEIHYYMRDSLMKNVHRCPYCSINQPETLDHYMPKSDYPALAMFRLNLVPMCPECNQKKKDYPYTDFIHSYYQTFPASPFLKATASVQGTRIVINFYLDETAIPDAALVMKLKSQIERIDLLDRMNKAATSFVDDLCSQCHCFMGLGFKIWLKMRYNDHVRIYGLNDWRSAAIAAMLDNNKEVDYKLFKAVASSAEAEVPGP